MQWTTGDDGPLGHLAESGQPFGTYKPDAGAVDVDVFIRSECVERGTQQWGSGRVNLATHDHNRHAVDVKPVNLQIAIDQCHCYLRLARPPTVTAHALLVNESIDPKDWEDCPVRHVVLNCESAVRVFRWIDADLVVGISPG